MKRTGAFIKKNFIEIKRSPFFFALCLIFPILFTLLLTILDKSTIAYSTPNLHYLKYTSLIPGTMMLCSCLPMYLMAATVSHDRKSSLLKRQYVSPMRAPEFIVGYAVVGFVLGIAIYFICYFGGWMIAACYHEADKYIPIGKGMLLILSQIPILLFSIFFGIFLGSLLRSGAPGVTAIIFIFIAILGGCVWPLDGSGEGLQTFCRFLPYYPSTIVGRVITDAIKTYTDSTHYTWDTTAKISLSTVFIYLAVFAVLSTVVFFIQSKKSIK